jgi:prevent-host-death family protein
MSNSPKSVPIAEVKNTLSKLVDRAVRGEEIIITRHGEAVARLMPIRSANRQEISAGLVLMRAARRRRNAGFADIVAWTNEGGR